MTSLLSVHDFRFDASGPALSFSLRSGQMLAVYGPARSGKTRFLHSLCGLDRNHRGSVRLGADASLAGHPPATRRATPESIARRSAGRSAAGRVAEALAATRLWEDRKEAVGNLSPSGQAASELVAALASPSRILIIDGQLDRLDLWTRNSVLELIEHRLAQGAALDMATSLARLAPRSDLLVFWRQCSLAFAGNYSELLRRHGPVCLEVETLHAPAVRALCDPFEVQITSENGVVKMDAKDGQSLAARMLLEGYGDVRAVVERQPTPDEVLSSL